MTHNLLHSLVIARAMSVEPIARLLCPDPLGYGVRPFVRSHDRWRTAATRAAFTNSLPRNLEKPR